jgi:DNA/RNA endonuclease G (NUC1)
MVAGQDRCNCFTADPLLPADRQIFTSDYTSGGFDRGHMTRSADRTAGNVDNATTYYLTNVVPQLADLNQGVWAQFENAIADSANKGGRAVYVITGPLYSRSHGLTFVKNEGKIAIPDSTWKIALIGPRNGGVPFTRGNLQTWNDLAGVTVLAVNMPNVSGIRNDPFAKYLTTVDKIEEATGFDFLSLLPVAFQDAVEAADRPPVAQFSVTGTLNEGASITFDASASTDPDLGRTDLGRTEALAYSWQFSDGSQASGKTVSKTFADNGAYTATLVVSDAFGWEKATAQNVTVANVAPTVSLSATTPVSILSGGSVGATGSFTDPGSDAPWHAVLDWGNGTTTPSTLNTSGASVSGTSSFFTIGTYTVSLTVTDKDGAVGAQSFTVTVARQPVVGSATPRSISLAEPPTGDIKITLQSNAQADISTLDLSSVSIGGVLRTQKKVKFKVDSQNASSIVLRFDAQALIDAGLITASTTALDLTGELSNGVQVISRIPFTVH